MSIARRMFRKRSRAVPAFLSVGLGAEGYFMFVARKSVRGERAIFSRLSESQFGGGRLFYVRCATSVSGAESGGSFFGGLNIGNRVNRILGYSGGKLYGFWKSIRGRKAILCPLCGGGFGSGVRRKFLRRAEDRHSGHTGGKFCCFSGISLRRKAILCPLPAGGFGAGVRRNIIRRMGNRQSGRARCGSFGRRVALFLGSRFGAESYFMSVARLAVRGSRRKGPRDIGRANVKLRVIMSVGMFAGRGCLGGQVPLTKKLQPNCCPSFF